MPRQYNYIYKDLVKAPDDLVGNIAYSLYKNDKIEFIENFKANHEGHDPDENDFKQFHQTCCMPSHIKRYKMQAVQILQNFMDNTLNATTKQIESEFYCHQREVVIEAVKDLKPRSFWSGVWQSVLGAFVFMILLCGIIFFASLSKKTYTFTIGGSGNAAIEEVGEQPTSALEQD